MFPQLETDRLRLRKIQLDDAEQIYAYFSKDEVNQYYGQDAFTSVKQAEDLIGIFAASYEEKKGIRWGIESKETNELIGTIGFHQMSSRHRRAEIGYELHPQYWGKGYASEAVSAAASYGFDVMELTRIAAVVFLKNDASNHLLMKLGFEREGILRNYMYQNGQAHDTYIYSLLKEGQ
ncbi:GNAT family protein [Sporosarcina sp.]|uniref:GNAT family N-acetyltransferase n=1 Tax=Sporosarcina sp. TaxID=49982 RepID=UPI0026175460|nr:GNAT family protein [Sporosarcina sp.]